MISLRELLGGSRKREAQDRLLQQVQELAAENQRLVAANATLGQDLATAITDATRRGLVLVHRLLDRLDELQRSETDPARLEQLYELDHLTIRLRRQAENLLVVADDAPFGDPDEAPMQLVDLLRLAASETEEYRRVSIEVPPGQAVAGWAARPLAQLVAALLDNALHYSPPSSLVSITAWPSPEGTVLAVRDHGIGMDDQALAAVNATVARPPLLQAAQSRQLGLFVTGTIANRLGTPVELVRPEDGREGLVALVAVPAALLAGAAAPPPTAAAQPTVESPSRAELAWQMAAEQGMVPQPVVQQPVVQQPVVQQPVVHHAAPAAVEDAPFDPFGDVIPTIAPVGVVPPSNGSAPVEASPQPAGPAVVTLPSGEEDEEQHEARRRRHRRRQEPAGWSIALDRQVVEHHEAAQHSWTYVADPTAFSRPRHEEPVPHFVAPAATFVPAPTVNPRLVHKVEEPDDYVPSIVDNPLIDILPEHPTALLSPFSPAPLDVPAATSAPAGLALTAPLVLEGIQMPGATDGAPPAPALPARSRQEAAVTHDMPRLFADLGATASADADGADALAGLVSADPEG